MYAQIVMVEKSYTGAQFQSDIKFISIVEVTVFEVNRVADTFIATADAKLEIRAQIDAPTNEIGRV